MRAFQFLAIRFDGKELRVLDQRRLPMEENWLLIDSPAAMIDAIKTLAVRGAPLIGVAAAISLALYRQVSQKSAAAEEQLQVAARALRMARPTAVNLMWAIDKMLPTLKQSPEFSMQTAWQILDDEVRRCEEMGKVGAKLIGDQESIITHCNTGGLATVGIGTALGVIRSAHAQGKKIHVYVDETRPLLQGGRLTTWELEKFEIPYTLICDNMAAALMKQGKVQRALVGADRIALNGDFANKIGTYSLSIAARHHQVPFHPVAPLTTVDFGCPDGMAIPIEERNSEEVVGITQPQKIRWAPAAAKVWNPAFDVTPATMLTSLILDKGILSGAQLQAGELKNFKRFLD